MKPWALLVETDTCLDEYMWTFSETRDMYQLYLTHPCATDLTASSSTTPSNDVAGHVASTEKKSKNRATGKLLFPLAEFEFLPNAYKGGPLGSLSVPEGVTWMNEPKEGDKEGLLRRAVVLSAFVLRDEMAAMWAQSKLGQGEAAVGAHDARSGMRPASAPGQRSHPSTATTATKRISARL